MIKIAIIGTGYVGLVSGICFAELGFEVICVDNNENKIKLLEQGILPIYEPGLSELMKKNVCNRRLRFTTDIEKAVQISEVIFITVGTPPLDDGSADLQYVMQVARDIALYMNGYKIVVDKSTVPVGTGQKIKQAIKQIHRDREIFFNFDVVSNPEFLREGTAIMDFFHSDRIIVGAESESAVETMKDIYSVLSLNENSFLITNIETAELIKYASNVFLATKITFINELTELCEKVGADIQKVGKGMGMDGRIGDKFLQAGPGYGGSCFPKDTQALVRIAKDYNCNLSIINAVISANLNQKLRMVKKIENTMISVKGKTFAILGLAFKPETDDMREAPAITLISELYKKGAKFRVYDPEALKEARYIFKNMNDRIIYCEDKYAAIKGADALVIITEWNQFKNLDLEKVAYSMKDKYFFDLRNIYNPSEVISFGFNYYSVGRC